MGNGEVSILIAGHCPEQSDSGWLYSLGGWHYQHSYLACLTTLSPIGRWPYSEENTMNYNRLIFPPRIQKDIPLREVNSQALDLLLFTSFQIFPLKTAKVSGDIRWFIWGLIRHQTSETSSTGDLPRRTRRELCIGTWRSPFVALHDSSIIILWCLGYNG